jgi:glycosyltransferase involved in cell wall biosynthesis
MVAHNRYRSASPSGENRVVELEVAGLRDRGIEVWDHLPSSDEISSSPARRVEAAVSPLRPAVSLRRLTSMVERLRPDLIHLHNPYPLIPPSIVKVAVERQIPVVQTIHNGRHVCPKATFTRDGRECFDCVGRTFPAPSVVHRCYRQSRIQSMVLATSLALHRGTFARIARFLPVSRFLRRTLVDVGFPPEKMIVKPNGVPDPGEPGNVWGSFLFVGRLDDAKGIRALIEAWRNGGQASGRGLEVIGSGPLAGWVAEVASTTQGLRFHGSLLSPEVERAMHCAAAVVIPSQVSESFSLAAVEAFAAGRPVIATRRGALQELVDDHVGWLVDSPSDLAQLLRSVSDEELHRRGARARTRYLEAFTIDRSIDSLLDIYTQVLRSNRSRLLASHP